MNLKRVKKNNKLAKEINKNEEPQRQQSLGRVSNYLKSQETIDEKKLEIKIKNVTVYVSNVNGTGKTFAIKEDIKKDGKIYKYFPFGGFLTKKKSL